MGRTIEEENKALLRTYIEQVSNTGDVSEIARFVTEGKVTRTINLRRPWRRILANDASMAGRQRARGGKAVRSSLA